MEEIPTPAAPEPTALEETLVTARAALRVVQARLLVERVPARFLRLTKAFNAVVGHISSLSRAIARQAEVDKLARSEAAAESKRLAQEAEQESYREARRLATVPNRKRWLPMGACVRYRKHFFNRGTNVCPGCGTKRELRPPEAPAPAASVRSETEPGVKP